MFVYLIRVHTYVQAGSLRRTTTFDTIVQVIHYRPGTVVTRVWTNSGAGEWPRINVRRADAGFSRTDVHDVRAAGTEPFGPPLSAARRRALCRERARTRSAVGIVVTGED